MVLIGPRCFGPLCTVVGKIWPPFSVWVPRGVFRRHITRLFLRCLAKGNIIFLFTRGYIFRITLGNIVC